MLRFSALASHYKDLHLFDFDDEYLESSNERLSPAAKRIELKQRHKLPGDNILSRNLPQ